MKVLASKKIIDVISRIASTTESIILKTLMSYDTSIVELIDEIKKIGGY